MAPYSGCTSLRNLKAKLQDGWRPYKNWNSTLFTAEGDYTVMLMLFHEHPVNNVEEIQCTATKKNGSP